MLCAVLCATRSAHADDPGNAQSSAETTTPDYAASARVRRLPPPGVTTLDADSARARPAALGEPARALLDAPGVARSSFAGSELVVWGAAGNETLVYVDGVEIPTLFHTAGFRTTVHPVLIDTVSLIPGAAGAQYGRGLGGVVALETKRPNEGAHIGASVDAIDASLQGQWVGKRAGVLLGARYGYLDRVVAALAPQSHDVLAVPSHADGALKFMLRADKQSELSLTWIGAMERVNVAREDGEQRSELGFQSLALSLERRYSDGARVRVTPFVGLSDRRERSEFGEIPLSQRDQSLRFGLRAEYTRSIKWLTLSIGADVKGSHDRLARSGTLTLPAREGDVSIFGQVPVDALASDAWSTTLLNAAPYLSLAFQLRKLTLEPALRLENMVVSASRSLPTSPTVPATGVDRFYTFFEPRLRVSYRFSGLVMAEARAGIYHQAPSSTDLSAVFGSPTLRPARAIHASLGPRLELPHKIVLECVAYYRALSDLAARSEQVPPELANALVSRGKGQSYGVAFSTRAEPVTGLSLTGSYTLGQSKRQNADGSERLFDRDQTHLLSVIAGYTRSAWSGSLGLRAATGSPRTRVVDTYFDAMNGRVEPIFGVQNAARLPFFFQLNVHVEYRFLSEPVQGALLLDVLNLTNHQNVEQVAYNANFSQRRDVTGLPILALLGVRVGY